MTPSDFFRALYGDIPKGAALLIRFVADPEKDLGINKPVLLSKYYPTLDSLPPTWREDCNVFFGVGLRKTGQSPSILWPVLFADFDDADSYSPVEGVPAPTSIVRSGTGLHLYWKLDGNLVDKDEVYFYLRALQNALDSDPRAAEPERLLRVPGTKNVKYSPPRDCELLEFHSDRVYQLSDFALKVAPQRVTVSLEPITASQLDYSTIKFPEGHEYLSALAWYGWDESTKIQYPRFKSASDLDFQVCLALARRGYSKEDTKFFWASSPGLMRSKSVNRPDYIDRTIHRAFAVFNEQQQGRSAADAAGLEEDLSSRVLYAVDAKGFKHQVANFVAKADAIFEGQDGGIRVTLFKQDGRKDSFTLYTKALSSPLLFKQSIPPHYVWNGSGEDLSRFHQYLLNQKPKEKLPVYQLGRFVMPNAAEYVVGSQAVLGPEGPEDAPVIYAGTAKWPLLILPDWKDRAKHTLQLLLGLHQPEVTMALLGWTMSTFVAPRVREARGSNESSNGEFSGLWVWGEQGSGKSRTTEQFTRITGTPFTNLSEDSTRAALHVALSTSNLLPVFVDDPRRYFRRGVDDPAVLDIMRHAFNATTVGKGRKDLSGIREQPLTAPVIITSEQAIENDPALAERYLHVLVTKQYLRANPKCAITLEELTSEPIERLAAGFHLGLWTVDIKRAWLWAQNMASGLREKGAEDRTRKSVAQMLLGLKLAEDVVGLDYGMSYPDIGERLLARSLQNTGVSGVNGYSPQLIEMLDLIWNLIATRRLTEGIDFRVTGDSLSLVSSRLAHELSLEGYRTSKLSLTKSAIEQVLSNYIGDIVIGLEVRVAFPGAKTNRPECTQFNLSAIRDKLGMTGEPWASVAFR